MSWKKSLVKIVKPKLNKLDVGHRLDHSLRVYKNCLLISKTFKKVNLDALYAASLLHDIGQLICCVNEHSHNSIKLADKILNKVEFSKKDIPLVNQIIKSHDDYIWVKNHSNFPPISLEAKIFQDADRLESIGAIGIIRNFTWGARNNRIIWNPNAKSKPDTVFAGNVSSIHVTRDHDIKSYNYLNTKIAKKMAKSRYLFMQFFLKQFFKEWEFKS